MTQPLDLEAVRERWRCRDRQCHWPPEAHASDCPKRWDAEGDVPRLSAEVERLRVDRDEWQQVSREWRYRAEKAETENAKLRARDDGWRKQAEDARSEMGPLRAVVDAARELVEKLDAVAWQCPLCGHGDGEPEWHAKGWPCHATSQALRALDQNGGGT